MFKALKWKYVFSDGVRNSEGEGGAAHYISTLEKKSRQTLVIDSEFYSMMYCCNRRLQSFLFVI